MAQNPNDQLPENLDCGVGDCSEPPKLTFAYDRAVIDPTVPDGTYVPPEQCVGTLDYSTSECAQSESAYIASLQTEALQYAGGPVNVFPMLGVQNQGSTIDQPGYGFPLSSGTPAGYNVDDAFNVNDASWKSIQQGLDVTAVPAYIGYDFGTKKAWTNVDNPPPERYFPAQPTRFQVSTIKIRQGNDPNSRALQLRVEASDDGVTWTRVDVISLQSTDALVVAAVRSTAPYNKWRLVPTFFAGVASNSQWEVVELHLLESTQLSLDNIEDPILLENRDRAYCKSSVMLKATYDLIDVQTELAKFGINIPQTWIFTVSFAQMVTTLGRPVVVGDILELPGEAQFDPSLRLVRKWLEVTDTSWSTEGYTQNWQPNLYRFFASPIMPSIEHRDILGTPGEVNAAQSDDDILAHGFLQNQQAYEAAEAIKQQSLDAVPQDGQDPQDVYSGKAFIHPRGSYDGNDLYSADAIPPDGDAYTAGDVIPAIGTVANGSYHRQTYTGVPQAIRPPDRLLRAVNGRWRVIEINKRAAPISNKKTIDSIMASPDSIPPDKKI